ncbi:MAG: LacI family DNA-binding transcriptional regulator [Opitutaceae bacterium]|nr:LacI family DNA-binding transcriptional regulator [Opitutaceae bacterium]
MSNTTNGRVTIREVAKLAGVSPSTVSLVLNGKVDRMSAETHERVMQAVSDLGYATNQMARGLKVGYVPMIGLVVPTVANPFWGEFARIVENAAMARNHQVLLCNSERVAERERRYVESLLARGITGIILGSSPLSLKHLAGATKRGLKVVAFDRMVSGEGEVTLDSVSVENAHGISLATQHLIDLGHKRIGFVSGPVSSTSRRDRLEGFMQTMQRSGLPVPPESVWMEGPPPGLPDEEATEIGRIAALSLLRRDNRPTAIIAINDMTAVGVYAGARELGMNIPRDLSVVGFDDIHLCKIVSPQLTTVRQPLEQLILSAVELLFARMSGESVEDAKQRTFPPSLVVRESTSTPGDVISL